MWPTLQCKGLLTSHHTLHIVFCSLSLLPAEHCMIGVLIISAGWMKLLRFWNILLGSGKICLGQPTLMWMMRKEGWPSY